MSDLRGLITELRGDMNGRFAEIGGRFTDVNERFTEVNTRIGALEVKSDRHFLWLMGMMLTGFTAVIGALIAVSYQ